MQIITIVIEGQNNSKYISIRRGKVRHGYGQQDIIIYSKVHMHFLKNQDL